MPNRYLRASYLESERVNAVSMEAEVLWTRLLVIVDDFGRCEANPKILRPKLFPLRLAYVRDSHLVRWLAECEKVNLVRLYDHDGKSYLQMEKWEQGRAEKSKCPPPPGIVDVCKPLQTTVRGGKHPLSAENNSNQPRAPVPRASESESVPESGRESAEREADSPNLREFTRLCALHSVPEWYAAEKFGLWEAKQWAHRGTAYAWRKTVNLVARDYVNEGRPTKAAENQGSPTPEAPIEPDDWRDWLSMQDDKFKEVRWAAAPEYFKTSFDRWQKAGSPVNKEEFHEWMLRHG